MWNHPVKLLPTRRGDAATTVHAAIYAPAQERGHVLFHLSDTIQPGTRGFLADEASMVGETLYRDPLSFGLPCVFVGDHGQLVTTLDDAPAQQCGNNIIPNGCRTWPEAHVIRPAVLPPNIANQPRPGIRSNTTANWQCLTSPGQRELDLRSHDRSQYLAIVCCKRVILSKFEVVASWAESLGRMLARRMLRAACRDSAAIGRRDLGGGYEKQAPSADPADDPGLGAPSMMPLKTRVESQCGKAF